MRIIINEDTLYKTEFKSWKAVALRFLKIKNMTYRVTKD